MKFLIFPIFLIMYGSQYFLKTKMIKFLIKDLPQDLEGLKILHISDLHSNNKEKININIWKTIDKLTFDVVVITGDIILKYPNQLAPHLEHIKNLCNKKTVYFVDGNHDRFCKFPEFRQMLSDIGVKIISNEKEFFQVKDSGIEFIGIGQTSRKRMWYIASLFREKKPLNSIRVVLCHMPQLFDLFKIYQPEITFSGHTHGGQLRLPFSPVLYAPDQGVFPKYGYGVYEFLNSKLVITKGIGHTFFPIRFWNRPEMLLVELKKDCNTE